LGGRRLRRREFISLLGATATEWPLRALSQTRKIPVIGFLNSASAKAIAPFVAAFHRGLNEEGYAEGQNVAIEYRWADGQYERLRALAADLVGRQVVLIAATGGIVSAQAAQAATSGIPILFVAGFDPVQLEIVASLNRPGRNATGVSVYTTELIAKRLDLLRDIAPRAARIALLLNPNGVLGVIEKREMETATQAVGVQLVFLEASAESDLEAAFASAVRQRAGALLVSAYPFFTSQRAQLVALAARHAMPTAYPWREYVEAGGLMSYGPDIEEAYRQIGRYAGRILKGASVNDLPVQLPTKFQLAINLKTATALGLTVPRILLARADILIE
jgi:putative tryptophan/tyrosine transport system substrate-binding protein